MGIDYYSCVVCGEAFPDVIDYGHCGNCEETLCADCRDEMGEKYGVLGEEHEKADWYGEEAPNRCDACENHKTDKVKRELFERVEKFMIDNRVTCEETIHQCDRVIENAYEFMEDLFNIIKSELKIEDEE
jgi:hypothetical protein